MPDEDEKAKRKKTNDSGDTNKKLHEEPSKRRSYLVDQDPEPAPPRGTEKPEKKKTD